MDAETFRYRKQGRSQTALLIVIAIWAVLLLAIVVIDAAIWLMALFAAFTLPALWDIYKNTQSGLDFTPEALTWFSGRREGCIPWHEIAFFRLDTRLDFSVRVSAVLRSGRKIRLPYECTPPHQLLEAAVNGRGFRTERHHFSLLG